MTTITASSTATRTPGQHLQIPFGAALVALAIALLLFAIPVMASVSAPAGGKPAPVPAPAPAALVLDVRLAADFPERARPAAGCEAILLRSSAIDNGRADRAAAITTALLEDACFGA